MAKVTFVQSDLRDRYGILCLNRYLTEYGHEADVLINDVEPDLVGAIEKTNPDLIAFSTMTAEYKVHLPLAEKFKQRMPDIPILFGGPHPTFYPDMIYDEPVDVVCVNEGEEPLVELLNVIDRDGNIARAKDVKNLWVKVDGKVAKNEQRNLVQDLDSISPTDRDIYYNRYPDLKNRPTKTLYAGRGCPFACTYCFNHALVKMSKGKGSYIRMRSVDHIFEEIRVLDKLYGLKWVHFNDDTFNFKRKWLHELLDRWPTEIGKPFLCNVRAEFIDEDLVRKMKNAGLDRVNFGIEHGKLEIRKLMKRNMSDDQIVSAGKLFQKYDIRVYTTNIIGIPGETVEDAMKTIEINRKVKPEFAGFSLLQPFPKTEIYDYAVDNGFLRDDFSFDQLGGNTSEYTNRVSRSAIVQDNINELKNMQKLSHYMINYPWAMPLWKLLAKLPMPNIYERFYLLPLYIQQARYENSRRIKFRLFWKLVTLG